MGHVRALLVFLGVLSVAAVGYAAHLPAPGAAPDTAASSLPPPQAPADGYRHRHRSGVQLRFDAELGVYAVADDTDVYFFDGAFLRFRDGIWQFSARLQGPWKPWRTEWVPLRLRVKHFVSEALRHRAP